jgi:hypothetical protein
MADAFLPNLGHLISKFSGRAWIRLIVPPSPSSALFCICIYHRIRPLMHIIYISFMLYFKILGGLKYFFSVKYTCSMTSSLTTY